jgi:hypothetical protein
MDGNFSGASCRENDVREEAFGKELPREYSFPP